AEITLPETLASARGKCASRQARRSNRHEVTSARACPLRHQNSFAKSPARRTRSCRIVASVGFAIEDTRQDAGHMRIRPVVRPRGTYLFSVDNTPFPLEPDRVPDDRRYPGYSLIGRIGDRGTPFYVGSRFQGVAPESGPLWLGINDPAPQHNTGEFRCRVALNY